MIYYFVSREKESQYVGLLGISIPGEFVLDIRIRGVCPYESR
jgi:hypothetical protein